mmetsp:Transcript_29956/g.41404  ORF Transcript_29956/g.41404 Transcript_29956/m.41404 type:complete len:491 (+) Transcript_29956:85-1557(+)
MDSSSEDEEMRDPQMMKEEGNGHYQRKEYAEAISCYTDAIILSGENDASLFGNRAAAYMMTEDFNAALDDCKRALELDPTFVKGHMRAAKCYTNMGHFHKARESIAQGLKFDPRNKSLKGENARLVRIEKVLVDAKGLVDEKKYVEALQSLANSDLQGCAFPALLNIQGRCLLGMGQHDKALSTSSNVLRMDSQNVGAMEVRGLALLHTGNSSSAQQHFQQALRLDPDNQVCREYLRKIKKIDTLKKSGNEAFSAKQWGKAEQFYSEAISLDSPDNSMNKTLYSNRAAAKSSQGRYKEALFDCNRALKIDPSYLRCLLRRADIHTKLEMFEEAVQDYSSAKEMEPNSRETERLLREAKFELKKSKRKDYYRILEVPRQFTSAQLKKSYHKAALKWHPDKHDGEDAKAYAESKFKDVNEAYSVLSDPKKKSVYDSGKDPLDSSSDSDHSGFQSDVDPNELFNMFFTGGGGGRRTRGNFGGGSGFHYQSSYF